MANQEFFGKYRGIVTNVNDPLGMSRIKARIPAITGDCESGWCLPCLPYPVNNNGLNYLPSVGDCVWIEFERGNTSYPIWVGCWYSNQNKGVSTHTMANKNAVVSLSDGDFNMTNAAGQSLNVALILKKFKDLEDWCLNTFKLK